MLSNFLNTLWTISKQHRQHECHMLTDADLDQQAQLQQREPRPVLVVLKLRHLELKAKTLAEFHHIMPSERTHLQSWTATIAHQALEIAWKHRDANQHVLILQTGKEQGGKDDANSF